MSRYDIALGRKKIIKVVKQSMLDKIKVSVGPNNLGIEEKAAICLIISNKLFPNSEDVSINVAVDLMYLPDFIVSRIANRILGVQ